MWRIRGGSYPKRKTFLPINDAIVHASQPDALEHPALEHSTFIPLPLDQRIIEILSGAKSGAKISSAKKQ